MKRIRKRAPLPSEAHRLIWSRKDLQMLTGLCRRSIFNLEKRGLLRRVEVGLNKALYSNESVVALLRGTAAPPFSPASPSADAVGTTPPESPQNQESHE